MNQIICSDVNQRLSILDTEEGLMQHVARINGRDMDELISEMYSQRHMTMDEKLMSDDVEYFHHNTWTVQKVDGGTRAWNVPVCLDYSIKCPKG